MIRNTCGVNSWEPIRQLREKGACAISQFPYKDGGGITPHRGKHDGRLVYYFLKDEQPFVFVAIGGLSSAEDLMDEILGSVLQETVRRNPFNSFNKPRRGVQ